MSAENRHRFGRSKWNVGQSISMRDIRNSGMLAQQLLCDGLLSEAYRQDTDEDEVESGFVGDGFRPRPAGGLVVGIHPGMGFYSRGDLGEAADASAVDLGDADEQYTVGLVPFALEGPDEVDVTLDAHDPTNPRIDVIYVLPTDTDTDEHDRRIRPAGPGSSQVDTLYQKTLWSYTITVAKGTAAGSPAVPSTPARAQLIAVCRVPATSGNVTVEDVRPLLCQSGPGFPAIPGQFSGIEISYGQDIAATEIEATVNNNLTLTIDAGYVDCGGARRYFFGGTATFTNAHATLPRWDLLSLRVSRRPTTSTGMTLVVTDGTAAAIGSGTPAIPAVPAGHIPLYAVYRAATDNSIGLADVYDVRRTKPYPSSLVHFSRPIITPHVTLTAEASDKRSLTILARDQDGNTVMQPVYVLVEIWGRTIDTLHRSFADDVRSYVTDIVNGTVIAGNSQVALLRCDYRGAITLYKLHDHAAAGQPAFVTVRCVNYVDADDETASVSDTTDGYTPGGEVILYVDFA